MWSEARKLVVSPGCHIRLTKYALTAGDLRIASGIPFTSKFGMTLVKREPGPNVITSASAIAFNVSGSGLAVPGLRRTHLILLRLRLMRVSPTTFDPSSRVASKTTLLLVAG